MKKNFSWAVRVYFEDTDVGGVVYYANYLKYLERARSEWLRALGFDQGRLMAETGLGFAVRSIAAEYLKPARLDDELRVTVALERHGTASMTIAQQAWRGDTLLADGEIRIGCVDDGTFKPRRIPIDVIATFA